MQISTKRNFDRHYGRRILNIVMHHARIYTKRWIGYAHEEILANFIEPTRGIRATSRSMIHGTPLTI